MQLYFRFEVTQLLSKTTPPFSAQIHEVLYTQDPLPVLLHVLIVSAMTFANAESQASQCCTLTELDLSWNTLGG